MYKLLNNVEIHTAREVNALTNALSDRIDSAVEDLQNKIDSISGTITIKNVPVGEVMFWGVSEKVERVVHSDNPFTFTVSGIEHTIEGIPDETLILTLAKDIPEGWHALDGSCELDASQYTDLAKFMPDNITTDGKIWLPYVKQKIIKIKDEV